VAQFAETSPAERDGVRATQGAAQPPGITRAVAAAWVAVNFDRVLDDLQARGVLSRDTTDGLSLGWDKADDESRQKLLADLDPMASSGHAFAAEIGGRTGLSAEQVLHRLNSAPVATAPNAAARLLMESSEQLTQLDQGKFAEVENQVAASLRVDFDQLRDVGSTGAGPRYGADPLEAAALPGRWAAERAIEVVDHAETNVGQEAVRPAPDEIRDFRTGTVDPSGALRAADAQNEPQNKAQQTAQTVIRGRPGEQQGGIGGPR
jgi:hypothetical protein